jgi:hypothetical protein
MGRGHRGVPGKLSPSPSSPRSLEGPCELGKRVGCRTLRLKGLGRKHNATVRLHFWQFLALGKGLTCASFSPFVLSRPMHPHNRAWLVASTQSARYTVLVFSPLSPGALVPG